MEFAPVAHLLKDRQAATGSVAPLVGARAAGLQAVWIDRLERRWPLPLPEPVHATTLVEAVEHALADRTR